MLGDSAYASLARGEVVPGLRATGGGSALETLARLFILQMPVLTAAAAAALPGDDALALGLVIADGPMTKAVVDVRPYGDEDHDWYVVSDLGVGLAGQRGTVSRRPRPRCRWSVDDTGSAHRPAPGRASTGPGHRLGRTGPAPDDAADQVIATDTYPRALALAALTAGLSGVTSSCASATSSSRWPGSGPTSSCPTRRSSSARPAAWPTGMPGSPATTSVG